MRQAKWNVRNMIGVAGLALSASAFGQHALERHTLPMVVPDVVARSIDLGQSASDLTLHVAVSLPYRDAAGMQAFVDSVSDPKSPNYRQFITPEEVGARFGLSDQQVQSVVDHLKANGFNVTLVGKNRLSILADCTVAQAEKAFGTTIHEYQAVNANEAGNTRFHANSTALSLPASIASYVIDVTGLESFTKPQPRILNPTQARGLYGTAPAYAAGKQGQGRTVGISNFDGYRLTNVPKYYTQYSLPTPPGGVGSNITVVTISGGAGAGSAQGEGDLDIQMPLGMAPLCNLRIYDGGSSDLIGVLSQEVNDNAADVISESYGWQLPSSTATSAHNLHVSMSAQGITYMAATGDSGTTLEPYSYPDYEPEVLQVGGTVPVANASGVRTSETGWSGSGGGWSTNAATFNVLPSWQVGTGVPTNVNKRLVPDVALGASGSSGAYYFYYNGNLSTGSVGTSFASPLFAGGLAVAEQQIIAAGGLPANGAGKQRFGRIQNLFYSQNGRSDVWYDITSGSNGSLPSGGGTSSAHAGWDYVTGWGAINFNSFVSTQTNTPIAPQFTTNPQAGSQYCTGGTITFTAAATGFPAPTLKWRRNSVPLNDGGTISGTTTTTLTITPSAFGDAGIYDCVATNTSGSVTSGTATVAFSDLVFTQQPADQTVPQGGLVTFTVATSGPAPTAYQWKQDGNPVFLANAATYSFNAQPGDEGVYTCDVTGPCGIVTSNGATLAFITSTCYANCDGSTSSPVLTANDFTCFLTKFRANDPYANCDGSTGSPTLTASDFTCFLTAFRAGCP
jgi:subtilase family serine protease